MPRKLMMRNADGSTSILEEALAANEEELRSLILRTPSLLPLEEMGLAGPAIVVGRESSLDSGRVDLIVLTRGGELLLIEFKTGPQNSDFRDSLAQLLDYGADLWTRTVEEFDERVVRPYFRSQPSPASGRPESGTLEGAVADAGWEPGEDAQLWRDRLSAQLKDGGFHYVVVAQRFTPSMLRTLGYLNAAMRTSRFSAVELIRFGDHPAPGVYEARFLAGPSPTRGSSAAAKTALAGLDDFLGRVTDDRYRHALQDFFTEIAGMDAITVYWGTSGCSLRVAVPNRNAISIGWFFPPDQPGWLGLTDTTFGWYEDVNGLALTDEGKAVLNSYIATVRSFPGAGKPKPTSIQGWSFHRSSFSANVESLVGLIRTTAADLVESAQARSTARPGTPDPPAPQAISRS